MAASSSGALKAKIESLGLSLAAYRDAPPEGTAEPYVTIHEAISLTPDDSGDNGASPTGSEEVQVSLWQKWHNADKSLAESLTLANALHKGLHGSSVVNVGSSRVYGCRVTLRVRQVERDNELVHDALTVELRRAL